MIDYPTLHLDRNQYRNIAFIVYIVNEGRHMIIINNHKINIKMTEHSFKVIYLCVFSEGHENQISSAEYVAAKRQCDTRNSYIKWYSNTYCSDGGNTNQHWTSITREDNMFSLTIYGKIQFKPYKEKRNTPCTKI